MSAHEPATARLPPVPRHGRSAVWGGVALLVLIELTVMSSLVVSYFYLRVNSLFWPPPGVELPRLLLPSLETGLLLALILPMWLGERAWRSGRPRRLHVLLPVVMGLLVAALGVKGLELAELDYSWRSHAYGSVVWTLHGYSALHVGALLVVLALVWLMAVRGHLTGKRQVTVEAVALYAYFVGASSLLTYATTTLAPHLL
jgi:cytochrome c oxidase subunit III